MSKKRKTLILLGLALLLALCAGFAVVAYYMNSPGKVKALVEQCISAATGTKCSVSEFSYSLNPISVHARGIRLADHTRLFSLEIPDLVTELSFQGSFTRRSLIVKRLALSGPSLKTNPSPGLAVTGDKPVGAGFFGRLARRLVALLLFQDIQVQDAELSGGYVSTKMGESALTVSGIRLSLDESKSLRASCYGHLRWGSAEMEVAAPLLQLTWDRALSIVDPEIRLSLKAEDMTFLLNQAKGSASRPFTMHLSADGFVDLAGKRAGAQRFHLIVTQIMEAAGAFHAVTGDKPEVKLTGLVLQITLNEVWPLLAEAFGVKPSSCTFGGAAHVTGNLSGVLEGEAWQWACDLEARLKGNEVSFTSPGTRGRGMVTANLQVKGLFPEVETALTFAAEKAELSWKGMGVKSAKAAFSSSGKGSDFHMQHLSFQIPQAEFTLGGRRIRVADINAEAQTGTIRFDPTRLSFPRIGIHTSLMKNLRLSLDAHDGQASFGLEGEKVRAFHLAQVLDLIPAGWQLEGLDSLLVKGSLKENGHWFVQSKWNLDQFAFQSPDSKHAGEAISLGLDITVAGGPGSTAWAASVEGSAGKGGFLYDRIYLDLHKNSLHFQLQGDYDLSKSIADISGFKFVVKDLLSFEAEGQITDPMLQRSCRLHLRLPQMQLKPVFEVLFKDPLKQEMPFLAALDMGGDFKAEMEFQKENEGWRLLGHCAWREGKILGKGFAIEGIELDLPFWGELPEAWAGSSFKSSFPFSAGLKREGALFVQSITLPYLPKQSFAARTHTSPNSISFIPEGSIQTAVGKIELGPTSLNELFTPCPCLMTSATLKEGDLAPMLSELWSHPVQGSIQGKLDAVRFDCDRIQTKGNVAVRVFGGEVLLSKLGVSGVLGSTPTLLLDATWKDMNLAELTEGTPFEKIEGILKGRVEHLEMVGNEPQRFDLFMETVKAGQEPQKISVRALENIARLGGSESPFIGLAGAFTSLFGEFPYDKIAIQASLENDVFRIDGPLREGNKVYLVKRSGLSGVNVVNQDPDRQISFKDMVKRIKRVTASKSTVSFEEQNPKSEPQTP